MLLLISCPLAAQDRIEPRLWSIDVTPQIGYRTSMNFIAEPDVDGVRPRFVLNSSPSFGVGAGIRYNDEDLVEFRWARQDTQMYISSPLIAPFRQRVTLDQFHLDCSHEYVVDEWPVWVRPYIMASVGATHVSGAESLGSLTRFSFGIGTGIKFFPTRQIGFKVQAEWLPIWITHQTRAFCSGGCIIRFSGQVISQGEVTMGPVFRF